MIARLTDRLRAVACELAAAARDVGVQLQDLRKPCTCGNPGRVGPCPRHGTFG